MEQVRIECPAAHEQTEAVKFVRSSKVADVIELIIEDVLFPGSRRLPKRMRPWETDPERLTEMIFHAFSDSHW